MAKIGYFSGKKVLVTGAGGFIGSHLCEALVELGAEVTAVIRYSSRSDWGNLEFLPAAGKEAIAVAAGNIEDAAFVNRIIHGHEIVFHLAALIGIPYSYIGPLSYVRTNVEGTLNILEAARNSGVKRLVHTSTSETYGTAMYTPIDEEHPLQGQSPYSASKIGADKIAESYYRAFDVPVATIRPFNTYGPRQSARAVIPAIISQALTRDSIQLGSLDPIRDMTFVADTVRGFIKIAQSSEAVGQVVNIGSGRGVAIGDLAAMILELMGLERSIVLDGQRVRPAKSEVFELLCNNAKAYQLLGWEPMYSLKDGLLEAIDFVSKHRDHYNPDVYTV